MTIDFNWQTKHPRNVGSAEVISKHTMFIICIFMYLLLEIYIFLIIDGWKFNWKMLFINNFILQTLLSSFALLYPHSHNQILVLECEVREVALLRSDHSWMPPNHLLWCWAVYLYKIHNNVMYGELPQLFEQQDLLVLLSQLRHKSLRLRGVCQSPVVQGITDIQISLQ